VYAVRGNHDVSDDLGFFAATREVTGRVVRAAERLWLAGVGWTGDRPYDSPEDEDLGEVCAQVEEQCRLRVANTDRLILLSHFPPEAGGLPDVGPQARPYQVVNELIASIRPIAVVAGHVHDWFGTQANLAAGCGGVLLCNPGPEGGTLTIEPKTGEVSFKPAG
jgi:Icc-related predicted phosphoesterase